MYIGIFFDKSVFRKLEMEFGFDFPNHYAHHVTLWHSSDKNPMPEIDYGKEVSVVVTGVVADEYAQTLVVDIPFQIRKIPHITMSTASGVKPYYSNRLLQNQKPIAVSRLTIKGKIGWWDGNSIRYDPIS